MSRNLQLVTKWLPFEIKDLEEIFKSCQELKRNCASLLVRITTLLEIFKKKYTSKNHYNCLQNELHIQELEDLASTMNTTVVYFEKIFQKLNLNKPAQLLAEKIKQWKDTLWKCALRICYLISELINEIAYLFIYYGEIFLTLTLRISTAYNNLLTVSEKFKILRNTPVCSNTCPYLLFPLRKVSVTRLLQIIANNRAEVCCHKLIDCLLETYKMYDTHDDDNSSDNSSLEIYRALTKHMSPPDLLDTPTNESNTITNGGGNNKNNETFLSIEELIDYEEKNVLDLLDKVLKICPIMLGNDSIKKTTKGSKIRTKAREKVLEYYEQILWGEVGNYLEHIVLWWGSSPLSARAPHSSQHLREWITQFLPTAEVPPIVLSALATLADALGVHVTSTSWDQLFRQALVSAQSSSPDTGKLFSNVLHDLVNLCNQCEITPDWIVGAPLDELPLVEQIPVLHRLDHSIHTTRLWAVNETKKLANNWNVSGFFAVTHNDIVECMTQLNLMRCADHTVQIEKGGLGVHVQVCALMRAKLISEVMVNKNKLKQHIPSLLQHDPAVLKQYFSAEDRSNFSTSLAAITDENFHHFDDAIENVLKSQPLVAYLKSIPCTPNFENFLKNLQRFIDLIDEKLETTGVIEIQRHRELRLVYAEHTDLTQMLEEMRILFQKQEDELQTAFDEQLKIKNEILNDLDRLNKKFDNNLKDLVQRNERALQDSIADNERKRLDLEQQKKELKLKNRITFNMNCQSEMNKKEIQKKFIDLLTKWLAKYDKEMMMRQKELEDLEGMSQRKMDQLNELQAKYDEQRVRYEMLMTEKRLEEERIFQEKLTRYVENRAAKRLQRAWYEFKASRKTKKKKKRGKKK